MKFYEKITSEKSRGRDVNCETTIKISPKSLRVFKNLSALRNDSPKSPTEAAPMKLKETPDGKSSKKMKQVCICRICVCTIVFFSRRYLHLKSRWNFRPLGERLNRIHHSNLMSPSHPLLNALFEASKEM